VYDNFDWNERVQHKTTFNANKHLFATTSKLILNPEFPHSGLYTSMLKPAVKLTQNAIFNHPVNKGDSYMLQCQLHWIAEAIVYVFLKAKELDLLDNFWPSMPMVDCLPL